jgi:putative nucleotidyltransferase with HDIG domain
MIRPIAPTRRSGFDLYFPQSSVAFHQPIVACCLEDASVSCTALAVYLTRVCGLTVDEIRKVALRLSCGTEASGATYQPPFNDRLIRTSPMCLKGNILGKESSMSVLALATPDSRRQKRDRAKHVAIMALYLALRAKDPPTAAHSRRVARLAVKIGRKLGLPKDEVRALLHAGFLHDIGKFAVPDAVLSKPDELDPAEREMIERHVRAGCRIVASFPMLWHLLPAIAGHHERMRGDGYPASTAGEHIPLSARVLAVADTWDALVSDRPYRRALPHQRAKEILLAGAGRLYDPKVVAALMAIVP